MAFENQALLQCSKLKIHQKTQHADVKVSCKRSSEQHEDLIRITPKKPIFECGKCETIMIFKLAK